MLRKSHPLRSVALFTSLVIILGIVVPALLLPGAAVADSWSEVARGGLDGYTQAKPTVSCMAVYDGSLFAGTGGEYLQGCQIWRYNGGGWENVSSDGFGYPGNVEATAMAVYDGDLYVGTRIEGPPTGCQIWRYDGDSWSPVTLFGFGNLNNTAVSSMIVCNSDLYVGTANDNGCEVRRLHNGSWSRVGDSGFGTDQNKRVSSLAVWNGTVYAGTENQTSGCHVYCCTGADWKPLRTDGFGDVNNLAASAMASFNGSLYVGTQNGQDGVGTGCQVWSFNGTDWNQQATNGFGRWDNATAACMCVYNNGWGDALYVGTATRWDNGQCSVWRYDGSSPWSQVGSEGLGNILNSDTLSLASWNGALFAGTRNELRTWSTDNGSGCEVRRLDGGGWQKVNFSGFTMNADYSVASMASCGGNLFAGTANCAGAEVWKFEGNSDWSKVADAGFGDRDNTKVSSMAVDETTNTLYVGTYDANSGCSVLRYDGGTDWKKINKSGFGDPSNREASSMVVFNSKLYVGTYSPWSGGCRVYRYDGFDGVDFQWTNVVGPGGTIGPGFGNPWNPRASSMAVNGPQLYVGTMTYDNRGCEVWSTPDGVTWSQVASGGIDNNNNEEAASMASFHGDLYMGTDNYHDGARLYRYSPSGWQRVSAGLESSDNDRVACLEESNSKLYAGMADGSCQVWSSPGGEPDSWEQANTDGFMTPGDESVVSLAARPEGLGSRLYAGITNTFSGAAVEATDPAIESADPPLAVQGRTLDVKIAASNTHFQEGVSRAVFSGEGILVNSTSVIDSTHVVANITISDTAQPLPRNVNVETGPEAPDQLVAGFTVLLPGVPSIASVSPMAGEQGRTMDVKIVGTNTHFVQGQSVTTFSGGGITVQSTKVADVTHATARIKVDDGAATGPRNINVTTGIEVPVPSVSAFSVTQGPVYSWYLAEGSTGPGFETWVLVQNPNAAAADINITYMTADGPVKGPAATVPPDSRMTFNVAETVPDRYDVSTVVTSSRRVAVERSMYGNDRKWGTDSIGTCSPAKTWYLPEGSTGPGFETWVLVLNPNNTPAKVSLTYMTPHGAVPGPSANVPANARMTFNVANSVPRQWSVSTMVVANKPVVAERATYWGNRKGANESIGAPRLSAEWYLPEGCTAAGFETWVLVQNPNDAPAKTTITYMTPDGAVRGPTVSIPAKSRKTFNVADSVPNQWSVSTRVSADKPVVAERSTFWGNRTEGHDSIGVISPATTWCLPEGSTGPGFETWILVQNPNDSEAKVSLTYMGAGADYPGPSVTLPAHSRKTFNVADTVSNQWEVSTRVDSNKPVVAERAAYGNARTWGTDSVGFPW